MGSLHVRILGQRDKVLAMSIYRGSEKPSLGLGVCELSYRDLWEAGMGRQPNKLRDIRVELLKAAMW